MLTHEQGQFPINLSTILKDPFILMVWVDIEGNNSLPTVEVSIVPPPKQALEELHALALTFDPVALHVDTNSLFQELHIHLRTSLHILAYNMHHQPCRAHSREQKKEKVLIEEQSPDYILAKRVIHMIEAGPTDEESKKLTILFSSIDSGDSTNILFYEAYQQMELNNIPPKPLDTSLYDFAGNVVHPLGQILLPLSLGMEPNRKTKMIRFLIVDMPSAYNIILWQPTLNVVQVVVSTYHMKVKFPAGVEIGEVIGNQYTTRK
ncbi:UNVERIFIED_CONTAM: hypothetical protein Scaly_2835200 [Sesamum calycinum]|uniref:Uncharacterized protein n=1 Tax=Sesamum calycinum TaxID=2727403 RepID=A0AAW2IS40_9LAMI